MDKRKPMLTFRYKCNDCGQEFQRSQHGVEAKLLIVCLNCGEEEDISPVVFPRPFTEP